MGSDKDSGEEGKPPDDDEWKKKFIPDISYKEKNINLESVLHYHEEIEPGVERHFANNLDLAFAPCRLFMLALFRFPLQLSIGTDFTRQFSYSWKSFRGWMFFITGALLIINGILISFTLGGVLLNFPEQPASYNTEWEIDKKTVTLNKSREVLRIEELFLVQRNYVPIIIILLALAHVCSGDVALFFKRKFIAKYFTFWDDAVEIMKIDAAKHPDDVRQFMFRVTLFYCGFMIVFMALSLIKFAPISTGGPAQLVILWGRTFFPAIHAYSGFQYICYIGDLIFAYIVVCSKVYVLLFLYKCKIIKNAFATWNERLEAVLHKGWINKTRREHCETRTGFDHLYRDYVVLLDLLRGSDTMFTNVIETYYGTQIFSICFEIYYFYSSLINRKEFQFARQLDAVLMGVYVFHSLIILFLCSSGAADVGNVAMNGLEIIRRKGFLGRKSNDEMYFTMSLYLSYTGHFETALTGGRYVVFDRGFLVSLVGTAFSYGIILFQFTPPLAILDKKKLYQIKTIELLKHVESTREINDNSFKVGYDQFFYFMNSSDLF